MVVGVLRLQPFNMSDAQQDIVSGDKGKRLPAGAEQFLAQKSGRSEMHGIIGA